MNPEKEPGGHNHNHPQGYKRIEDHSSHWQKRPELGRKRNNAPKFKDNKL